MSRPLADASARSKTNLATTLCKADSQASGPRLADRKSRFGDGQSLAEEAGQRARQAYIATYTAALPREAYWLLDDNVRCPKLKWHKLMTIEADKVEARAVAAYVAKV